MSNETTFVDKQTVITAGWANDVDHLVYALLGPGDNSPPNSVADVRAALGIGPAGLTTGTAINLAYAPGPSSGIPNIDVTVQSALDYLGVTLVNTTTVAGAAMARAGGNWSGPVTFQSTAIDGSDVNQRFTSGSGGSAIQLTMRLNPTTGAFEYQNTAGTVTTSLTDAGRFTALQLQAGGQSYNNALAGQYAHNYLQRAGVTFVDEFLDTSGNYGINVGGASPINAYSVNQAGLVTLGQRPYFGANLAWDAGNFIPSLYALLNSAPTFTGQVSAPSLSLTGKEFATNGAQLLANSTGELGLLGWSGPWLQYSDLNGTYFGYPGTGVAQTGSFIGPRATVAAASPITVQLEAALANVTAGTVALQLTYLNGAGATISTASIALTNGTAWTRYWATFTTPALCVAVMVAVVMTGATVGTGSVPAVRRIKVEYGTTPSTYSQEATSASGTLANVSVLGQASSSARFTADYSNSTYGQRALFQSMTANGTTIVGAIPATGGLGSQYLTHGQVDPSNSSRLSLGFATDGLTAALNSDATGSGILRALRFQLSANTKGRIETSGRWLLGPDSMVDDNVNTLQVASGINLEAGALVFPDGTQQVTANGTTNPTPTVFSVLLGNVALGATALVTTGYIAPFVDIYRNGSMTTNGIDWSYAGDGKTINLTYPVTNTDNYDVRIKTIYTPSSVLLPTTSFFTPAAGATSISIVFTAGFARLYQGGVRLVSGQDYDQLSTPNTLTLLNGNSFSGQDTVEVEVWQPVTVANMMPLSGGVFTGPVSGLQPTLGDYSALHATTKFATDTVTAYTGTNLSVGFRNRVLNGGCLIAQRGAFSATSGISGYGGPDRFVAINNLAGGAFGQTLSVINWQGVSRPCVAQTVTSVLTNITGTNFWSGIRTHLEGWTVYDLIGQPVTLSFLFQCTQAGTYSVALRDGSSNFSYVTTFTGLGSSTPQLVTIVVPALPSGLNIAGNSTTSLIVAIGAQNNATYMTTTQNVWQAGLFMNANTQTFWGLTSGAIIAVAELQLEAGTVATPFERRQYAQELLACQRHCQIMQCNIYGYNVTGQAVGSLMMFPVPMRATPSVTTLTTGTLVNCSAPTATADNVGVQLLTVVTATGAASAINYYFLLSADL